MSDKVRLSLRVRPNSEAPRWVYDAIVALEAECDEARADADAKEALLQAVARACRGVQLSEEALSVLRNVLRERDEARAEVTRLANDREDITRAFCAVADHLGVSAEALVEDPSVVVRLRTAKDAEIARLTYELEQGRKGQDDFGCCGGSDETPPEHTQDCSVHPGNCYACKTNKSVGVIPHAGAYETRCAECLIRELETQRAESHRQMEYGVKQHELAQDAFRKRDALRLEACHWLESICQEFESTIAHAEWVRGGQRGMGCTFTGDFANVVQLPSVISRMRWWVQEWRKVLKGVEL